MKTTFWNGKLNENKLGAYVYALVDPTDDSVFYVGLAGGIEAKGNNRPDCHLIETSQQIKHGKLLKGKNKRIAEMWSNDLNPKLLIVRRNLGRDEAIHVEAALIDLLNHINHGKQHLKLTNDQRGHGTKSHSIITEENRAALLVEKVQSISDIRNVWLFPIKNGLKDHGAAYEAIRGDWRISQKYRGAKDYAIGLEAGISRIVVKINKWSETGIRDGSKQSFEGSAIHEEDVGYQLFEKDFSSIVKNMGYWKQGNPIKVHFSSSNKVEIIRGLKGGGTIDLD